MIERYLETLGRLPTDEEVADMVSMSRRGFFALSGALLGAAAFWEPTRPEFIRVTINGHEMKGIMLPEPGDLVDPHGILTHRFTEMPGVPGEAEMTRLWKIARRKGQVPYMDS